jgi:hypothetical protein
MASPVTGHSSPLTIGVPGTKGAFPKGELCLKHVHFADESGGNDEWKLDMHRWLSPSQAGN